jgi:putative acetyltransferase
MSISLKIVQGDPSAPQARSLIAELDSYLAGLYPAESNHGLTVEALLDPSVCFYLATCGDEAVGCGGYKLLSPDIAEIKRMYVRPAHRGSGFGRVILAQLEGAARAQGATVLRLETGIWQPEALGLYERCGYYRIGPFADYWDDPLSLFYEKLIA